MSPNLRNQQSDGQASSGRSSNENLERKKREWFEGMNYEQRRQSYTAQKINRIVDDKSEDGNDARRRNKL